MIFNENLNQITEIDFVEDFIRRQSMETKLCNNGGDSYFVIYRHPYSICIWDALVEDYLEIVLVDLNSGLLIEGGSVIDCCIDLSLLRIGDLSMKAYEDHPQKNLFLSSGEGKLRNLYSQLQAIDKFLPHIESAGGLLPLKTEKTKASFDFSRRIINTYPLLKENILRCFSENG